MIIDYSGYQMKVGPSQKYIASYAITNNQIFLWLIDELIEIQKEMTDDELIEKSVDEKEFAIPYRTLNLDGDILSLCLFYEQ